MVSWKGFQMTYNKKSHEWQLRQLENLESELQEILDSCDSLFPPSPGRLRASIQNTMLTMHYIRLVPDTLERFSNDNVY